MLNAQEFPESDRRAIEALPGSIARQYDIAPIAFEDGTLVVAAVNDSSISDVAKALNYKIRSVPASLDAILSRNQAVYATTHNSDSLNLLHDLAADAIRAFVERGASDIHFQVGAKFGAIKIRTKGRLSVWRGNIPRPDIIAAINSFCANANVDINRTATPRDGRFPLDLGGVTYDFRLQTSPTQNGDWLTVRGHNSSGAILTLAERGMRGLVLERVLRFIRRNSGLFLLTGEIGSGKTSTFYSIATIIRSPGVVFRSAEQPIESNLGDDIGQTEIKEGVVPTFDDMVRSWVREDVNVMAIGELRDVPTIKAAIQSGLVGHFVLATAHASDAKRAIARLRAVDDESINKELLVLALNAIVNQKLILTVCQQCSHDVTPHESLVEYCDQHGLAVPKTIKKASDTGCNACGGTGYSDRTGVFEVLDCKNDDVIDALLRSAGPREIAAADPGFEPMVHDALSKVIDGITTLEEVDRCFQFLSGEHSEINEVVRTMRVIAKSTKEPETRKLATHSLKAAGLA